MNTDNQPTAAVELAFSDGRPKLKRIVAVNETLHRVGVHVSSITPEPKAVPILSDSRLAALDADQNAKLLQFYSLDRAALLDQIAQAGRVPSTEGGGALETQEEGVPPYPKIYDMKAMSNADRIWTVEKYSKLHVNTAANGVGVDEVMSLVSGGPWTWFFLLLGNVTGKLMIGEIGPGESGEAARRAGLLEERVYGP